MRGERIYGVLPTPLQHIAVTGYGFAWKWRRQGGQFKTYRNGFSERDRISESDWTRWQTDALREVLRDAWTVPHYRSVWSGRDFSESDVDSFTLDQLKHLPLLDKESVRHAPERLCPGGAPSRTASAWYTSGSTGTPLTTYHDYGDFRRGLAMRDARYETFLGVTHRLPRATIRGRIVVPDPESAGPYYRFNLAEHQIYLSPYHLGPHTVSDYVGALRRHGSRWLDGYASSIHDIAHLALEQGIDCPQLAAVVTCAEPTTQRVRDDVQRAFGCKASEDYGLVEECCAGLECEQGSLHMFPDAGYVEILDEEGERCGPGQVGEIVATSFLRKAQPFVRYRTGDLAAWSSTPCACGRAMPIFESVEGRLDDVVIGADGRRLGRLSTVPKHLPGVVMMQFVQDHPGQLLVRVVADGPLHESVKAEVNRRLVTRLGPTMAIDFEQVAALERTPKGKIRSVISNVKDEL